MEKFKDLEELKQKYDFVDDDIMLFEHSGLAGYLKSLYEDHCCFSIFDMVYDLKPSDLAEYYEDDFELKVVQVGSEYSVIDPKNKYYVSQEDADW